MSIIYEVKMSTSSVLHENYLMRKITGEYRTVQTTARVINYSTIASALIRKHTLRNAPEGFVVGLQNLVACEQRQPTHANQFGAYQIPCFP